MSPNDQSLAQNEMLYPTELVTDNGCHGVYIGSDPEPTLWDPRYQASGLYTDEYTVQSENGVLDILEGLPDATI